MKNKYLIIGLSLSLALNVLFTAVRVKHVIEAHENLQTLRTTNAAIYLNIKDLTQMLMDNSDIMMRFSHHEKHHDPNVKNQLLCPECTSVESRDKDLSSSQAMLTEAEVKQIEKEALTYCTEDAIYDADEIRQQISRLCITLVNQKIKLEHTLEKMRLDSKSVKKPNPITPPHIQKVIQRKDGIEGLQAFNQAIVSNIHPDLHNKLAPVVAAIRYAENGGAGREYGVLHSKVKPTYRSQAGWCAATVQKNWQRYIDRGGDEKNLDQYLTFLGNIYCPLDDPNDTMDLNKHWKKNVLYFYRDFQKS